MGVDVFEYDDARTKEYPLDVETLAIQANKGMGKTENFLIWLQKLFKGTSPSFITPTFRRSFCDFFRVSCNTVDGIDLMDYREPNLKKNGHYFVRQLAVQLESIHAVMLPDRSLELLAIDEIESVLDQLQSPTMNDVRHAVYNKLCLLLRKAKYVVVLDADISARTIEWIQSVRGGKITMHRNKYPILHKIGSSNGTS